MRLQIDILSWYWALCRYRHNAHLLRDLESAAQTYPEAIWPTRIATVLRALIHATNLARDNGKDAIDPSVRTKQLYLLRQGVKVGLSATLSDGNAPGENTARLLLEAFRDREAGILRFVDNLAIPATSDDAERGLRLSKIQQKISSRLTSTARTKDRHLNPSTRSSRHRQQTRYPAATHCHNNSAA
ncbi:MAG TPA: transposase [Kineosporiaceae bacterium]